MSERELRDRVEVLFDELKREREKLEGASGAEQLASERTALRDEVVELRQEISALRARREDLPLLIRQARLEADLTERELDEARRVIARHENLGDPLGESRSNWEGPEKSGCAMLMVVGFALAIAIGWLS